MNLKVKELPNDVYKKNNPDRIWLKNLKAQSTGFLVRKQFFLKIKNLHPNNS